MTTDNYTATQATKEKAATKENLLKATQEFPRCPHLWSEHRCCLWLSERLSRKITVSPITCNFDCQQSGGPYCGRPISDQNAVDAFAFNHWFARYSYNSPDFAKRVRNHYEQVARIAVPPEWPAIKNALDFLYQNQTFVRILLTGSVITDAPRPLKDYDILLIFDSMRTVIEREQEMHQRLPKTIEGVGVDYFFSAAPSDEIISPDTFYVQLDPENRVLYTSRWFRLRLKSLAPDIKLEVAPSNGNFAGMMDQAISNHPFAKDKYQPPTKQLSEKHPI